MSDQDVVLPRHDLDAFVTCPKCLCLGTHTVEQGVFRCRTEDLGDGEVAEIRAMTDPPNGTPVVYRTCTFCGYGWRKIAEEAARCRSSRRAEETPDAR